LGRELQIEDPEQWLENCPQRVYDRWRAAYRLRPFGDEQRLLSRAVSLLYLIAAQNRSLEDVCKASDALMRSIMPHDCVDQPEPKQCNENASVVSFEQIVSKVFG
jgi:hypothetical protein